MRSIDHANFLTKNNKNTIGQSKLGTGTGRVIVTHGGRPTHSSRAQSFNRICQVAPMCTPILFLGTAQLQHRFMPPYC